MQKAKVYTVGIEMEIEAQDVKSLWKQLAFFQSLPAECPIDGTPTRLFYKEPEGNAYFSVANSGQLHFEYKLGQYREGGELFGKGEWWWWDWQKKEDVLLCKWGELTEAGERMRARCLGAAPVAHKGSQPQAGHRGPVRDELDSINVQDAEPLAWDMEPQDTQAAEWEAMGREADAHRKEERKAKQPFAWPQDEDMLEVAGGFVNGDGVQGRVLDLCVYIADKSAKSNAMSERQYGFLGSLLDKRYGKDSHKLILSALCKKPVSSANVPGFGAKELIDWLKEPDNNSGKMQVLDQMVEALKADLVQFA